MRTRVTFAFALAVSTGFASAALPGTIVLKTAFVKKHMNRATFDGHFIVDHAHPRPNRPVKDGDMHIAGRSAEVGLPMVAEIINAAGAEQKAAVSKVHAVEDSKTVNTISGVWRLWFEHPANRQIQFDAVSIPKDTNPDHSFEIHPVTAFAGKKVPKSFEPIEGFTPYDVKTAFETYEGLEVSLATSSTAITIDAKKAPYNYVEFYASALGHAKPLDDGGVQLLVDVEDSKGKTYAENIRLIFAPGTLAAEDLAKRKVDEPIHVLGIPRLNLNSIYTFAQTLPAGHQTTRRLPYEIIVAALFPK